MLLAALPGIAGAQSFSPGQRAEIVEILREALRSDPSLLREAQAAVAAAAEAERLAAGRAAISAEQAALFGVADDPVLGDPRARLVMVEFADPRCGYCKQLHVTRQALLARRPELRVVVKDLAILGPLSDLAVRGLKAAQRQGRYAALHNALYRLREEPTEAVLRREAERVGLDWGRLRREMDDPAIARGLAANLRLAQALGIEGTPALVFDGALLPGAVDLETLDRLVAGALQR